MCFVVSTSDIVDGICSEAFSKWLENVVAEDVQEDVQKAQTTGDHIDQVGKSLYVYFLVVSSSRVKNRFFFRRKDIYMLRL